MRGEREAERQRQTTRPAKSRGFGEKGTWGQMQTGTVMRGHGGVHPQREGAKIRERQKKERGEQQNHRQAGTKRDGRRGRGTD